MELLLDNSRHTVYTCRMSPNAKTVIWVHYTRDNKGEITRTELKFIRRQGDGWSKPATVLGREGCTQFMSITLANNDVLAYSLPAKAPSARAVFLRPDLKPGTRTVNINKRMSAKR